MRPDRIEVKVSAMDHDVSRKVDWRLSRSLAEKRRSKR